MTMNDYKAIRKHNKEMAALGDAVMRRDSAARARRHAAWGTASGALSGASGGYVLYKLGELTIPVLETGTHIHSSGVANAAWIAALSTSVGAGLFSAAHWSEFKKIRREGRQ